MVKMAISQTIRSASPFLKWAGGKTQLLPALLKNIPAHFGTYIEPFVGGGALFFELQPAKAILADSNSELINCYTVVRDNVEDLIGILSAYPYSGEFYYKLRAEVPGDVVLRAARIIYLNRTCYNGLYRVNKRGQFNVPFGRYKNPIICDAERLRAASYTLKNTELFCADYQETLRNFAKPGDFFYIDDQRMLARTAIELAGQGCFVLVSNSYCDFILDVYEGCKIIEVSAKRNINKDPNKRGGVKEVLVVCKQYHSNQQRLSRQLALWEVSRESSLLSGTL